MAEHEPPGPKGGHLARHLHEPEEGAALRWDPSEVMSAHARSSGPVADDLGAKLGRLQAIRDRLSQADAE